MQSRLLLALIWLHFVGVICGFGATLGPEVAVLQIRVGKEKKLRQVVIGFYDTVAPRTVENFKALARKGYYRGMRFHRVFPKRFVQTGDPLSKHGDNARSGTGGPGYTLPPEIHEKHLRGSVVAARLGDTVNPLRLSNGSQFYVCLEPLPDLDGKYTVFGEVLEGIEQLEEISEKPTDSNDFLLQKIVIVSVVIEERAGSAVLER